jgi:hypothetical protein
MTLDHYPGLFFYNIANLVLVVQGIISMVNDFDVTSLSCGKVVWCNIFTLDVIRICMFIYLTFTRDLKHPHYKTTAIHLVWIWAVVDYYTMSDECSLIFNNDYKQLLTTLYVETIVFFIIMAIAFLVPCLKTLFAYENKLRQKAYMSIENNRALIEHKQALAGTEQERIEGEAVV